MARAMKVRWAGIAVGLALGTTTASKAMPPTLLGLATSPAQVAARPSRVHAALNSGIDSYRRGDYETAASFFQQADAGQADLSPEDRMELANFLRLNNAAFRARQEGCEQIRKAEEALEAGRRTEAENVLKMVVANQFLATADKIKAQRLLEQTRGVATPAMPGNSSETIAPVVVARTKLQQARILMAKGNYDAAEALAREAAQLQATYAAGEDTPRRVLDDIARTKNNAKSLLITARSALQAGDLEGAENLAHASQRAASAWSFRFWGDSPAKVLKDVQAARAHVGTSSERQSAKPSSDVVTPETGKESEFAHQLVKDGRKALQAGNVDKALQCAVQAQSVKAEFHWWEDSPSKLMADIQRNPHLEKASHANDNAPSPSPQSSAPQDPHQLLQQARGLYESGKFDDSQKLVEKIQASGYSQWGLFEDSPENVMRDVRKARFKRDQEESIHVMAEARSLYEKGDYEGARTGAFRAEKLHGPYSVWDLSDRPEKLIAEIEVAKTKQRKNQVVSAPTTEPATPAPQTQVPALHENTVGLLSEAAPKAYTYKSPLAETILAPGIQQPTLASMPAPEKENSPWAPLPSAPITPASTAAPVSTPAAAEPIVLHAASSTPPAISSPEVSAPFADRAHKLLAECRALQAEGRLVEARQKALEAQKTGTSFATEEDRPERALLQLAGLANKRVEHLTQQATDFAATGFVDHTRFQKAEDDLAEARHLAIGFSLDTQGIDTKLAWVKRTREQIQGPGFTVPGLTNEATPPANAQANATFQEGTPAKEVHQPGEELLDKARLELRRGATETARRLAVEVYSGSYGLKQQADAMLHSIDAEEYNQRVLGANRSFEAGLSAYLQKDYYQSATVLRAIDASLLGPDKQSKLKELMMVPELQGRAVAQASLKVTENASPPDAGKATASDTPGRSQVVTPEENYAKQVQAMQEVKFQKLRRDGLEAQRNATDHFRNGDTSQALDILQNYLDELRQADLEPDRLAMLQRPVDSRLQQFKTLKAQHDFEHLQAGKHDTFEKIRSREEQVEEHKKQQVAELMKQYHDLTKEAKYKEAEMVAMRAHELDPDNAAASAGMAVAKMQRNEAEFSGIKDRKEDMVLHALNNSEDPGKYVDSNEPMKFDLDRWQTVKGRKVLPLDGIKVNIPSERERDIERHLSQPISVDFRDEPLKDVIADLRQMADINIVPDQPALEEENISLDRPITMHLEGVTIKSALDLILHQAHLIYVIKDEVLQITTEAHARGKLVQRTFQVADLIIPVPNFPLPDYADIGKALNRQNAPAINAGASTPYNNAFSLGNGSQVGSSGASSKTPNGTTTNSQRAPGQTMEDLLIKMITNTIKPESWDVVGGPGTIEYYPLGMALIISQTPDIQEQVAELLAALRRLQDIEVAVEVRFITIAEAFFERIGIDFNVNVLSRNTKYEPQIVSQQFQPFGFNNAFTPNNFVAGILPTSGGSPPVSFTSDLNIPVRSSSFGPAIPPFGGFPNTPGTDGGLSLGLAFLSDIQVFLFMEAAQGDRRTNVMQAPKLTMFNGQTATISIQDMQFYVTQVNFIEAHGQLVVSPFNQVVPVGISLTVQAVVSADRRFVRLNLPLQVTNISNVTTALFPITTFITPVFENGAQGQPVPFQQFIEQPKISSIDVTTTVSVPDGGTVLLGGLKTLREGRNEYGPPILSKLPYLNRLFKNTGYGRDAESLLMLVTPRVIINEEEETRQTGFGAGLGLPGAGGAGAAAAGPQQ